MTIKNYKLPPPSFNVSPKKDIGSPDGDTIKIEQPLRMVSCDTPEKERPYGKATTAQPKLDITKQRLQNGFFPLLPKGLVKYLADKITADAAKRHINAGKDASDHFEKVKDQALNKPGGKRRKVGVLPSGEVIDRNGRLLAYVMTYFDKNELPAKNDPSRRTYNLIMVEDGWAVFFPIWPSLPKAPADFDLIYKSAKKAWTNKKGMWNKHGNDLLLPYEYRLLMKLSVNVTAEKTVNDIMSAAFQRVCVNLRNMKMVGKFDFYKVPPSHRFWIWEKDWNKDKTQIKSILGVKE
ncbi:MAG: thermonuclease family protein [Pyrinomonadaceae bacterium]